MKNKVTKVSIVVAAIAVIGYALVFFIGSSKGVSWLSSVGDKKVATVATNIEMYGYNGRDYEWKCAHNPSYMCGAVATSEGVGGYSYPIATK